MSDNFLKIDVSSLIPQKAPFIMTDKLIGFDQMTTTTEFTIRNDNIFVEQGVFTVYGLIENVAQTCAARMGYINLYLNHDNVKLGFIGAIKDFEIHILPSVGETITTTISVKDEVMRMTLVEAVVSSKSQMIAHALMKIALSDIDSQK